MKLDTMNEDMKGKVVVITGATSGVGRVVRRRANKIFVSVMIAISWRKGA